MSRADAIFVLRVLRKGDAWLLTLQDLRTGRRLEFSSWEALVRYVRSLPPRREPA